jgi:hypothetical protein
VKLFRTLDEQQVSFGGEDLVVEPSPRLTHVCIAPSRRPTGLPLRG